MWLSGRCKKTRNVSGRVNTRVGTHPTSTLIPPIFPERKQLPASPGRISRGVHGRGTSRAQFAGRRQGLLRSVNGVRDNPPYDGTLRVAVTFSKAGGGSTTSNSSDPSSHDGVTHVFRTDLNSSPAARAKCCHCCDPKINAAFPRVGRIMPSSFKLVNTGNNRGQVG